MNRVHVAQYTSAMVLQYCFLYLTIRSGQGMTTKETSFLSLFEIPCKKINKSGCARPQTVSGAINYRLGRAGSSSRIKDKGGYYMHCI